MLKVFSTKRGFKRVDFSDKYGTSCSIQNSSLATEDCIWFGVDHCHECQHPTRMHLTQAMVKELLPLLEKFVKTGEIS